MCGFFAIGRSRLLELAPQTSRFKIVFETMVRARGTLSVSEIPVVFRERVHGKSKMSFGIALRFFSTGSHATFEHLVRRASRSETSASLAGAAGGVTSRGSRRVAPMHRARRGSSCRPTPRRSRPYRDACRWRSNICLRRRYNRSSFRCSTEGA